jgi:hypothetical protein
MKNCSMRLIALDVMRLITNSQKLPFYFRSNTSNKTTKYELKVVVLRSDILHDDTNQNLFFKL